MVCLLLIGFFLAKQVIEFCLTHGQYAVLHFSVHFLATAVLLGCVDLRDLVNWLAARLEETLLQKCLGGGGGGGGYDKKNELACFFSTLVGEEDVFRGEADNLLKVATALATIVSLVNGSRYGCAAIIIVPVLLPHLAEPWKHPGVNPYLAVLIMLLVPSALAVYLPMLTWKLLLSSPALCGYLKRAWASVARGGPRLLRLLEERAATAKEDVSLSQENANLQEKNNFLLDKLEIAQEEADALGRENFSLRKQVQDLEWKLNSNGEIDTAFESVIQLCEELAEPTTIGGNRSSDDKSESACTLPKDEAFLGKKEKDTDGTRGRPAGEDYLESRVQSLQAEKQSLLHLSNIKEEEMRKAFLAALSDIGRQNDHVKGRARLLIREVNLVHCENRRRKAECEGLRARVGDLLRRVEDSDKEREDLQLENERLKNESGIYQKISTELLYSRESFEREERFGLPLPPLLRRINLF